MATPEEILRQLQEQLIGDLSKPADAKDMVRRSKRARLDQEARRTKLQAGETPGEVRRVDVGRFRDLMDEAGLTGPSDEVNRILAEAGLSPDRLKNLVQASNESKQGVAAAAIERLTGRRPDFPFAGFSDARLAELDPNMVPAMLEHLGSFKGEYPKTLSGLQNISPADDWGFHAQNMGGPDYWSLGVPTNASVPEMRGSYEFSQHLGDAAPGVRPVAEDPLRFAAGHETGHAVFERLNQFARESGNPELQGAMKNLHHQLIAEALTNPKTVSSYATNMTRDALREASPETLTNAIRARMVPGGSVNPSTFEHLPFEMTHNISHEPFAEMFARMKVGGLDTPLQRNLASSIADVESQARGLGWIGAADLPTLLKGAGGMGAFLAADYFGPKVVNALFKKKSEPNELLQGALKGGSIGGGIGSFIPGIGTGIGAGVGAGLGALASQVF